MSIEVSDIERSAKFYDAVTGALGWRRFVDEADHIGWGFTRAILYVSTRHTAGPGAGHIALAANGISGVKGAHESGLANGGTDDGSPGQRPEYGATYYSAYLQDPDGNRIEIAVGHQ